MAVELHLQKGARLKATDNIDGYIRPCNMINDPKTALIGNPVTGKPSFVFIYGFEADKCSITGEGTIDANGHSFVKRKLADMKFRGQMFEGASSLEHTLDSVEWMAKLGYNSFFIQFVHPYVFYKRWYHHYFNRLKEKENVSEKTYCL